MSDSEENEIVHDAAPEAPVSIEKPKKKRTPSALQLQSLAKAREARKLKAELRRQQAAEPAPVVQKVPTHVHQPPARRRRKPRRTYVQQAAEESSSSEEEIVYIAAPPKVKKKKKRAPRVIMAKPAPVQYESQSSDSSESEPEPAQHAPPQHEAPNFYFA